MWHPAPTPTQHICPTDWLMNWQMWQMVWHPAPTPAHLSYWLTDELTDVADCMTVPWSYTNPTHLSYWLSDELTDVADCVTLSCPYTNPTHLSYWLSDELTDVVDCRILPLHQPNCEHICPTDCLMNWQMWQIVESCTYTNPTVNTSVLLIVWWTDRCGRL